MTTTANANTNANANGHSAPASGPDSGPDLGRLRDLLGLIETECGLLSAQVRQLQTQRDDALQALFEVAYNRGAALHCTLDYDPRDRFARLAEQAGVTVHRHGAECYTGRGTRDEPQRLTCVQVEGVHRGPHGRPGMDVPALAPPPSPGNLGTGRVVVAVRAATPPAPVPSPGKSILQDWVSGLGLRHQGVLLTAVRGCDTAPRHDPSKRLTRCVRSVILNAHCGDPRGAATFIEAVGPTELAVRFDAFRKNLDHYPHHYVMHLVHAIEILGYKHPEEPVRQAWRAFYEQLCRGLHVNPETEDALDDRLNADEVTFAARD